VKRFVSVCIGSTALALGVAVAPTAAMAGAAAQAATSAASSPGQFRPQHVTISAPRLVDFRAASRATTTTQHPGVLAPLRYFSPSATAAQRAAAARGGGRHTGVVALTPSTNAVRAVTAASTLADFPAMTLNKQISDLGPDQALQPPDTQVAAGPGSVLEAVNDSLSLWSKTGSLLGDVDLNVFFPVPSTQLFSDPRVLYDAQSGRWLLSGFSLDNSGNSQTYIAVSQTSDPGGIWNVYTIGPNSGFITDQPMTGVCADKIVMAWNVFDSSDTFISADTLVLQKSSLVAGAAQVNFVDFTSTSEFRPVPVQSLSPTTTCWVTVNKADSALPGGSSTTPKLGVIAVTGTPNAANVKLIETDPTIQATNPPPNPQQPSGTTNNSANDDRLVSAVWQGNVLWTSATDACTPTGDTVTRNCMRLIEVSTSGSAPSVLHDEDVATNGLDEYYPAVSLSYTGDLFVSYTASSSAQNPGAYAIISPSTSGTAFTAPITIEAGAASYDGGSTPRWGDYSAAAPDPAAPGAVWVAAEYAPSDAASGNWATGAAEVTLSSPPAIAVGAEGPHDQLWVQSPLGSGWKSLGGTLIAPPAVAAAPNTDGSTPVSPLFIATSTNKQLYIRSLTAGWQRLGSASMPCTSGPAAMITGGTLTVACRGTNNALWYNTAPVPSSGLPQIPPSQPWANLGGVLTAGPAVAPVGGTVTFFAPSTGGRIWTRTASTGYSATPWVCIGSPAAAQGASSGTTFACQGGNHALYVATNGGAGWSSAVSLGGSLIGGPGVAATSRVPVLLAEGSNHAVYERTPLSWVNLGGSVVGGVAAVALN
jgi:hypothetical protein